MRFIYTLVFVLLIPVVCLRLLWRSRNAPAYLQRWSERFGFANYGAVSNAVQANGQRSIWIHAVSLGESIAARQLIEHILDAEPNTPVVVTNMTPTGSAEIERQFGNRVHNFYLPYDIPVFLSRFIKAIQPRLLIIIETELWPNLIFQAAKQNIPTWLVNARLSARSAKGYQRFAGLTQSLLTKLNGVISQGKEDGARFVELGLAPDKLHVSGSVKFDVAISDQQRSVVSQLRQRWQHRCVWIAASTHDGEDEKILEAHRLIQQTVPNALLVLAPRHPERFDAVCQLAEKSGLRVERRREANHDSDPSKDADVYLLDTLGELSTLYGAAKVAWIGGSFIDQGGHNPLEAAVWGMPILMGPSQFNFKEITNKLMTEGGLDTVESAGQLAEKVTLYFNDATLADQKGQANQQVVQSNQGAVAKLIEYLPIQS